MAACWGPPGYSPGPPAGCGMRPLLATSAPLRGPRAGPPARRLFRPGPPAGAYFAVCVLPWAFLAPASPPGLPLCCRSWFRRRAPPAWRGGGPSLGPLCFRAVYPVLPRQAGFFDCGLVPLPLPLCPGGVLPCAPPPRRPRWGLRGAQGWFELFPFSRSVCGVVGLRRGRCGQK